MAFVVGCGNIHRNLKRADEDDAIAVVTATAKRTRKDEDENRRDALDFDVSSSFLTTSFDSLSKSSTKKRKEKA